MRFTVLSLPAFDEMLADLWVHSADPQALTEAANWIESALAHDPGNKVTAMDNLHYIRRDPIVVLCKISEDDRLVEMIEVHLVDNG